MNNQEILESKINYLNELDLKGDLIDSDYEELKNLKRQLEKEKQKLLPKQVIVIRKDLNMPAGKLAAQVSHASFGVFSKNFKLEQLNENQESITITFDKNNKFDQAAKIWLSERFTKVIVYVKSEKALLDVYEKANLKGIPNCLIEDAGFTIFNEPTKTCLGIGPCYQDDLIGITDKLQLFKD